VSAAEYEIGCPCRGSLVLEDGRLRCERCRITFETDAILPQSGRKRRRQFAPWPRSRFLPRPPYPKMVPFG